MNSVYQLKSDLENYSHFLEIRENVDNMFIDKYWKWKDIELNTYEPVKYELCAGDNGKKNYKMDISTSHGLIILSEKAVNVLKDILGKTGQIVPIVTKSKRKKFFGFYPNKNIYDDSIINFEKSDYAQYEKGKVFRNIVLNNKYPKDDYIFTLASYAMGSFVTEKFKELIEENDLKGFELNEYTEIKVED
ncbi:hypothetical protein GW796_00595 [archaeon]|nr:hypothetical protein [archaeon]NCQ50403.1 hypothetical protein [archaeon]